MKVINKYIYANFALLILFSFAILLGQYHFNYLSYFLGLVVFFLPGINLALAIEQISYQKISKIFLLLSGIFFTFTLIPIFTYFYVTLKNGVLEPITIQVIILILWLASFLLFLLLQKWKKIPPTDILILPKDKIFYYILIFFLLATTIHFFLYPFIPEADPYTYLLQADQIATSHFINTSGSRPIFSVLIYIINSITYIDNYWIFKIILPLLNFTTILIFYYLSRNIKSNILRIVSSLAPLYLPVFYLEMLIPRPQTIFLILLPIALFVSTEIIKSTAKQDNIGYIYWLILFVALSAISIKIHEFFIFILIITLYASFSYLKKYLLKYPAESLMIFLIIILGAYPWLNNFGVIQSLRYFISPFVKILQNPKINLWFIDNYTNVDGNKMGWLGYTWILYYIYNIGIYIPCFFFVCAVTKKYRLITKSKLTKYSSIYILSCLLFFSIAEIFPRLGIAYLPDRAWLFASLSFIFFIPFTINTFEKYLRNNLIFLFIMSAIISLLLGWITTYAKQGWTTKNEFDAMKFIKNNTAPDSLIISQASNGPGISYYAKRKFIMPENEFTHTANYSDTENVIKKNNISYMSESLISEKEQIVQKLQENLDKIAKGSEKKKDNLANIMASQSKRVEEINSKLYEIEQSIILGKNPPPVYFLYSYDKFKTIYTMRSWWQEFNFNDLNVKKFNATYKTIYNQNGVYIWKLN